MILKSRLKFFPDVGKNFDIVFEEEVSKAKILPVHCVCMGPDKPHEHYYLKSNIFKELLVGRVGQIVEIGGAGDDSYSLKFRKG